MTQNNSTPTLKELARSLAKLQNELDTLTRAQDTKSNTKPKTNGRSERHADLPRAIYRSGNGYHIDKYLMARNGRSFNIKCSIPKDATGLEAAATILEAVDRILPELRHNT